MNRGVHLFQFKSFNSVYWRNIASKISPCRNWAAVDMTMKSGLRVMRVWGVYSRGSGGRRPPVLRCIYLGVWGAKPPTWLPWQRRLNCDMAIFCWRYFFREPLIHYYTLYEYLRLIIYRQSNRHFIIHKFFWK